MLRDRRVSNFFVQRVLLNLLEQLLLFLEELLRFGD